MLVDKQHERCFSAAFAGLVCAGFLAGSAALADTVADSVPDPAAGLLAEMRDTCSEGSLIGPEQPFQPIAMATDDTEISLFDQTAYECEGAPSLFRHTGGGTVILRAVLSDNSLAEEVSQNGDAAPVSVRYRQFTARGWHLAEMAGVPVLMLARHGSFCDQAGYMPCVEAVTWMDGHFLSVGPEDESP